MEKGQDLEKIKGLLLAGEVKFEDKETGRSYFISANCPDDNNLASLIRVEKVDSESNSITRAIFKCPICSRQFSVPAEEMFLM